VTFPSANEPLLEPESTSHDQPLRAEEAREFVLIMVNVPCWYAWISDCEQTIGRGKNVGIRVPDEHRSVSREHAKIWADSRNHVWIRDVGSRFGTAINAVPLRNGHVFQVIPGDRISLGRLEIDLEKVSPVAFDDNEVDGRNPFAGNQTVSLSLLRQHTGALLHGLSQAELEVVIWMGRGFTDTKTIGAKLHRSPNTVRTQLSSIFRKTGTHSREELLGRIRRIPDMQIDGSYEPM
jgi:DNA-binding CsgD family transcriptional regulator